MKRHLLRVLLFVIGFGLGFWLFRWRWFGFPTRAWLEIPYRFGVSWEARIDFDNDGRPDAIEYVTPRGDLPFYVFGFGYELHPDFREVIWRVGPVKRIRIWFQKPSRRNILVAAVAFRCGPEVTVDGQANLCDLLKGQPLPPFGLRPNIEDLGCGKSWPLR